MLANYISGGWKEGTGPGEPLVDPVTGEELARISSQGIPLGAVLEHARAKGGEALRRLSYGKRADMLAKIGMLLPSPAG